MPPKAQDGNTYEIGPLSTRRKANTVAPGVFQFDDGGAFARRGVGVRATATRLLTYQLNVVAVDVADAVRSAGGWMCDRVRAGWKVNVFVPHESDVRPLHILGVRALSVEKDLESLTASEPCALAIAAEVFAQDERLRRDVIQTLERETAEVTIWGDLLAAQLGRRVDKVQHRLSKAAQVFKAEAELAAGLSCHSAGLAEEFHSCALWYPPDGTDLTKVR
jgi:hypothetical protein